MSFTRWLSNRLGLAPRPACERRARPARRAARPCLEGLEARWVPSTLTVRNTLDGGAGSLRADVAAAHSGDTIAFAPGLAGQTITLTGGELLIRKSLTIAGPGAGQVTVSGNYASRVFEVAKGASVTLSGLTISGGAANGVGGAGEGGGILNHGTLAVSGSALSGNSASYGGGILNNGTLAVSVSTLSGNSASRVGGGIWNSGTATVSDSALSGNSAGNGGSGGGIYENGGTLTVSGSTLTGNTASYRGDFGYGGGIYHWAGALTVSGSTLSANSAVTEGGGIYNSTYGTATVNNSSSITGNTAPVGSGADVDNHGVLYLDASSVIGTLDGNPSVPI